MTWNSAPLKFIRRLTINTENSYPETGVEIDRAIK